MPVVRDQSGLRVVEVDLGERSYEIVVGEGLLDRAPEFVGDWLRRRLGAGALAAMIITDSNVRRHADTVQAGLDACGWRSRLLELEPGEPSKRLEVISRAWDELVGFPADRQTVVIAVGGGVVGDAAGFIAATFARGLPFVQIPTTLLADVDSAVGGKVGINHPRAKNLIGAFHQPIGVLIDTRTLGTLPDREYRSGLAEVVKYGVILDAEFFRFLEERIPQLDARDPVVLREAISRSCELKALVVEQDEYERSGLRAVLNYGHTFAHALEALTGYGTLLHGEAVSIGMVQAALLAEKLGRVDTEFSRRQHRLLEGLQLPVALPAGEVPRLEEVLARMQLDKKTVGGHLRFVLPTRLGHVELVTGVPPELVREVLRETGHP